MIYCIEDDPAIRNLMIYALKGAGLEARGFESAEVFWSAWAEVKPQMVMIDIMLPGEDGLSVLRKLRAEAGSSQVPVIITSAKGEEYDKVIGLDLGADDYLAKPFGMMEMISRVRAVLRRTEPPASFRVLRNGSLEMNMDEHTGLGLSIVKHAAMLHNATVDLNSIPNKGTTISIRFPISGEIV